MTELVQATAKSKPMTPQKLVEQFTREGRALQTIRMPSVRYETTIEKKRRLGGLLGTKTIHTCVEISESEEIAVWPIHPLDMLDHDELFVRYLTPSGQVYERDLDE